jgi:hypothetical protein
MHALQALGQIVEGWRQSVRNREKAKVAVTPKPDLTQKEI